jgi:tRNA1(Val) A37 N6-methylase TrmN6
MSCHYRGHHNLPVADGLVVPRVLLLTSCFPLRSLELGAGGGLVGLAVANGCELELPLVLTDQLEMFLLMKHNIKLNEMQGRVKAAILNWYVSSPQLHAASSRDGVTISARSCRCLTCGWGF